MESFIDDEVMKLIQQLHSSAIELKEKYDSGAAPDIIIESTKTYLARFDHLESVIPKEILEKSSVGRSVQYFRGKPGKNRSDIRNVCSFGTFLLATSYLSYKIKGLKDKLA